MWVSFIIYLYNDKVVFLFVFMDIYERSLVRLTILTKLKENHRKVENIATPHGDIHLSACRQFDTCRNNGVDLFSISICLIFIDNNR